MADRPWYALSTEEKEQLLVVLWRRDCESITHLFESWPKEGREHFAIWLHKLSRVLAAIAADEEDQEQPREEKP